MLSFCENCGSIMVLGEKNGHVGKYVCRNCKSMKKMKVQKIEIIEGIELEPEIKIIPDRFMLEV